MKHKMWSLAALLALSVMGPIGILSMQAVLLYHGRGALFETLYVLEGRTDPGEVTAAEFESELLPAARRYTVEMTWIAGPLVVVAMATVSRFALKYRSVLHYSWLPIPTAILASGLLLSRFAWILLVYAVLSVAVGLLFRESRKSSRPQDHSLVG